ncbi:MAG: hypothetical protein A3H79_00020 [Candidatus Levybacteria bacterium RIFCSPLOWO2_02_FULL_36_8b]|nr:MAG: hypothetical protein A3H79_00020 [Candidatus Levybacteria bacterium RIFCSPLOWO2_02_FULL_36_8b]
MFFVSVIIMIAISIVWSFISLKKLNSNREVEGVKKELSKGKVVFNPDTARNQESSSSSS